MVVFLVVGIPLFRWLTVVALSARVGAWGPFILTAVPIFVLTLMSGTLSMRPRLQRVVGVIATVSSLYVSLLVFFILLDMGALPALGGMFLTLALLRMVSRAGPDGISRGLRSLTLFGRQSVQRVRSSRVKDGPVHTGVGRRIVLVQSDDAAVLPALLEEDDLVPLTIVTAENFVAVLSSRADILSRQPGVFGCPPDLRAILWELPVLRTGGPSGSYVVSGDPQFVSSVLEARPAGSIVSVSSSMAVVAVPVDVAAPSLALEVPALRISEALRQGQSMEVFLTER